MGCILYKIFFFKYVSFLCIKLSIYGKSNNWNEYMVNCYRSILYEECLTHNSYWCMLERNDGVSCWLRENYVKEICSDAYHIDLHFGIILLTFYTAMWVSSLFLIVNVVTQCDVINWWWYGVTNSCMENVIYVSFVYVTLHNRVNELTLEIM